LFAQRCSPIAAKDFPACFRGCKCRLCPARNQTRLKFGNGSHLLQHEAAGRPFDSGQIGKSDVHASLQEARQEAHGPCETVDLGDHQGTPVEPCGRESFLELRSVSTLATLDLGKLRDGLPTIAAQIASHRFSLGFEA
jgi:hypothetical protein